jgi:hypothetical protein
LGIQLIKRLPQSCSLEIYNLIVEPRITQREIKQYKRGEEMFISLKLRENMQFI